MMYIIFTAAVLILMNTYFVTASRDMMFTSKERFIQNQSAVMTTSLAALETLTPESVSQVMDLLDVSGLTHITVVGANGDTLYETPGDDEPGSYDFVTMYMNKALTGFDVYYSHFFEGAFATSAFVPIMSRGATMGAVYIHEYDAEQGAILIGIQNALKNVSIVIIILTVCVVFVFLSTIMRRITAILKGIVSVREGEYNYKIHIKGGDELALLGDEFNRLTNRLQQTEEVRRRFVADASHELKTPLASIRLLSDSIVQTEDMDRDTMYEFVADIGNEAERLTRTTEKLLTLTKLDSQIVTARVPVDMRKVVSGTIRMLSPLAESNSITLRSYLDGGCIVLATDDDIYQIVFNIVENAIKYNVPGGSVEVRLTREVDSAHLTVNDTGIGVPETDLPNIFDRFYRVDKARSREAGGSGLGLSIVRATVWEHGGTIEAKRRDGGGMSFQVIFPLYTQDDDTREDA